MFRPDKLLSGMSVALVLALHRMLEVRTCRKRLPCFRQKAETIAIAMFNEFWQVLTLEQQEILQYRLLQCLYWRRLRCFDSWEHFQENWEGGYGLKEGLEGWSESRNLDKEEPLILILRVLRRRKIPISASEVKYCLSAAGETAKNRAVNVVYRLLLRGCYRVKIISDTNFKGLAIKYIHGREDWNLFPSS